MGNGNKIDQWSHDQDGGHTHIWYKPLNTFFSRTNSPRILELGMQHRGLKLYEVDINDDPGLT